MARKDKLAVDATARLRRLPTLVPAEAASVLAQEQREIAEDLIAAERQLY